MFDFSDQHVLVIGGSSGIGFSTAAIAASLGATVTIASRTEDKVKRAARAIGPRATGRVIDVTTDASVDSFFAEGRVWDHVVVTGSETTILPVRTSPLRSRRRHSTANSGASIASRAPHRFDLAAHLASSPAFSPHDRVDSVR